MASQVDVLNKNELIGVLSTIEKDGRMTFTKNCDVMTLMAIKSFIDYNINKAIGDAVEGDKPSTLGNAIKKFGNVKKTD